MKFSQWNRVSITHKNKFRDFCHFKELDESEILSEMAQVRNGRPEVRKVPHLLNGRMLFWLSQIPHSYWAEALSYFKNEGLRDIQKEVMDNIPPLVKAAPGAPKLDDTGRPMLDAEGNPTFSPDTPYASITGGTAEEKLHYDSIREYLNKTPPYNFVTLQGKFTFLVVNNAPMSPLASMYMATDNSLNDEWLQEKPIRTPAERSEYAQQGHGLHGEYLGAVDPFLVQKSRKEKEGKSSSKKTTPQVDTAKQYYQWGAGYRGTSREAAAKWLQHYFDNLHWHIGAISANMSPEEIQHANNLRQSYKNAYENNLTIQRIKQGGRKARRVKSIPVYSGEELNNRVNGGGGINSWRNAIVKEKMSETERKKRHIEIYPDGRTNIEIGIKIGHRTTFSYFDLTLRQTQQIAQLLQQEKTNPGSLVAQTASDTNSLPNISVASYIAKKVGIVESKVYGSGENKKLYTPEQVINAIMADNEHDACVFPWWDNGNHLHRNLGASKNDISAFAQAMPMHAPENLIPLKPYAQQGYHDLLGTVGKEIQENKKDARGQGAFDKFFNIYTNKDAMPEITPEKGDDGNFDKNVTPAVIRSYAQQLRIAQTEYAQKPSPYVVQELKHAGILVESLDLFEQISSAEEKVSKNRKRKSWMPLLEGMEIALFARAFQYWLRYQKEPPIKYDNYTQLPPTEHLKSLIAEFVNINKKKSNEILSTTQTADQFDDLLNKTHSKKEKYISGWHMAQGDPLTFLGKDEDSEELNEIVEEPWIGTIVQSGVNQFMTSPRSITHPANRRIIVSNDIDIGNLALSEFKSSKIGIKSTVDYIEIRRRIEKEGRKIDSETGEIIGGSPNDPEVKLYETIKQKFVAQLKSSCYQFTERIWQLNLGEGSRRDAEKKLYKTEDDLLGASDEDMQRKLDSMSYEELISRYGEEAPYVMKQELLNKVMPARSLDVRGEEEEGGIFGASNRRRAQLVTKIQQRKDSELASVQEKLGLKFSDPSEYGKFSDIIMMSNQGIHSSRQEGIKYIAETAKRERYQELQKSGAVKNMSEEELMSELERAGRLAAAKYLEQLKQVSTSYPDFSTFKKNCDQWNDLSPAKKGDQKDKERYSDSQQVILNILLHVEKNFFNENGVDEIKEPAFKQYLGKITDMLNYGTTDNSGNKNDVIPHMGQDKELKDAFDVLKEEDDDVYRKKKPSAPFRATLRKLVAYCGSLLNQYITKVSANRNQYLSRDLETLSNSQVLSKNKDWKNAAKNFLKTHHHQGKKVPNDLVKIYVPKIKQALKNTQRVA